MVQFTAGAGTPVTVACNVTWLLAGIVTAAGETVTVTLLKSKPLPPPQPAMTISRTHSIKTAGILDFMTSAPSANLQLYWRLPGQWNQPSASFVKPRRTTLFGAFCQHG